MWDALARGRGQADIAEDRRDQWFARQTFLFSLLRIGTSQIAVDPYLWASYQVWTTGCPAVHLESRERISRTPKHYALSRHRKALASSVHWKILLYIVIVIGCSFSFAKIWCRLFEFLTKNSASSREEVGAEIEHSQAEVGAPATQRSQSMSQTLYWDW